MQSKEWYNFAFISVYHKKNLSLFHKNRLEKENNTKNYMKLQYNSPVVLNYALICVILTALTDPQYGIAQWLNNYFTVYPFGTQYMQLSNPFTYFRLFSHALGHGNWAHFLGNFTFILLIGPILEEKYGSKMLLTMIFVTALVSGLLNAIFFSYASLGASGIVFMMILLVSFTNMRGGKIPITFILVSILFLGKEIYAMFNETVGTAHENGISEFAHIMGGVFGAIFGYSINARRLADSKPKSSSGSIL